MDALRKAVGPDPELFFGFDDLDLGLAISNTGATMWSTGLARHHGYTGMVENRRTRKAIDAPTWRRYYSLRNLIIILRRDGRPLAALVMSLLAGLAKPLANLPLRPRLAVSNLRLNALAMYHGWRDKAGKSLDPTDLPKWIR